MTERGDRRRHDYRKNDQAYKDKSDDGIFVSGRLVGTVEVIVFPRDYEKNREYLEIDKKIFVKGRVSEEEELLSKLICETIIPFEQTKKSCGCSFQIKKIFCEMSIFYMDTADSEGDDEVVIYCQKERAIKRLPRNRNIRIYQEVLSRLMNHYGEKRVKVVENLLIKEYK